MSESDCRTIEGAMAQLDAVAPGVPLLALGQTIFWDEPVKAAVALRKGDRPFVAGVHDTDYFAKQPRGPRGGEFAVIPHNDTTTKGLWSAAGEFSTLFGSETVVTRDALVAAGIRPDRLREVRPDILDTATEAFGWRGVVARGDAAITAELPIERVFPALHEAFDWALDGALAALPGEGGERSADRLRAIFCDPRRRSGTLGSFYRELLPDMYRFVANEDVPIETTRTTELLRFAPDTAASPRFALVDLFLRPESAQITRESYDQALELGSGQYGLAQFGTGAIPFDLVVPGHGRGTVRIGRRGLVVNTPTPLFASTKRPIESVADLADVVARKWGSDCVLVGKAVTLIGMLAREFVFVFHESASSYVTASRELHRRLAIAGFSQPVHPILRVRHDAWGALAGVDAWLKLPPILARPFGTEETRACSFANRWRQVASDQEKLLVKLSALRSPIDAIRFFDRALGGGWQTLATEYEELHRKLGSLQAILGDLRRERTRLYEEGLALRRDHQATERASGAHWRAALFDREPSETALAERSRLREAVRSVEVRRDDWRKRSQAHRAAWQAKVREPEILSAHRRRRAIELEAELTRLRLVREAITVTKGLGSASRRPAAWWLPLVSPDGRWFRRIGETSVAYLEPLT